MLPSERLWTALWMWCVKKWGAQSLMMRVGRVVIVLQEVCWFVCTQAGVRRILRAGLSGGGVWLAALGLCFFEISGYFGNSFGPLQLLASGQ